MNSRALKAVGAIVLGLAVALGAGWLWGASGRWDAERQLASARLERELTGARAQLLAARVDLYKLNFGSATSNFEAAKRSLQAGRGALDQDDDAAAIQRLQAATAAAGRRCRTPSCGTCNAGRGERSPKRRSPLPSAWAPRQQV